MTEFQGKIARQAWMDAPETVKVMEALHLDGGSARFVGGCVRDALANRRVVDIDIATPLKPDDVIERLKKKKIKFAPTGLKHGTVTAIADGKPFEITTLRVDVQAFGRHAEVAFTDDWKADAARRDFTINAMSATIDGDVCDYFGGMKDLHAGRVVFVGDAEKRIAEDHLRILRFFRFYAHFGASDFGAGGMVAPDREALAACSAHANLLTRLSAERIRHEILRLLEAPHAAQVWKIMLEARVVTQFLPEASDVEKLARLADLEDKYHDGAGALRRLAALLVTTKEGLEQVRAALKLSNAQGDRLEKLALPEGSPARTASDARVLVYREGNDAARDLLLLAAATEGERNLAELHDIATAFRPPRFPLEGPDVLALGYRQGPEVGRVLRAMEEWWISQDFQPGRGACLERLKAEFSKWKSEK